MQTTEPPAQMGRRFPAVLAQALAGDSSAFGELWRSAHPGLLRYLFVLCGGQVSTPAKTHGTSSLRPTHPDIDGAHGRCTAWSKGELAATSTAYHRLVADAGGAEQITGYCASILGKSPKPTHAAASWAPQVISRGVSCKAIKPPVVNRTYGRSRPRLTVDRTYGGRE
jgi:hypothetical protein